MSAAPVYTADVRSKRYTAHGRRMRHNAEVYRDGRILYGCGTFATKAEALAHARAYIADLERKAVQS